MSDIEDTPELSEQSLKALLEFYGETNENDNIEEDWKLSQFWYTSDTAKRLAAIGRTCGSSICCISSPTVFKELHSSRKTGELLKLLEYDRRFENVYGDDFVFYDYREDVDRLPTDLKWTFDVVIVDPPYLSEECLSKMANTMRFLTKNSVILCTGISMTNFIREELGLTQTSFEPQHYRKLGNTFGCFTNFPIEPVE